MFAGTSPEWLDAPHAFLRACAYAELDADGPARIRAAALRVTDWHALPALADQHGLAPLVWHHAKACGLDSPTDVWRQLAALAAQRRQQSRVQAEVLSEIVDALTAAGIEHVILKGAILAHVLYADPGLRPMSDLDILVAPEAAISAQRLLGALGFDAPLQPASRLLRFHHHLPPATRRRDGVTITVEVHRDALSGDQPGTLRLGALSGPPREVVVGTRRLRALGHVDMLVHLSWHVLEPREYTRLISVADFVGYAARYRSEIDWSRLRRAQSRVVNALALMHYVTPLPEALHAFRPSAEASPPSGAGRGFLPLRSLAHGTWGARRLVRHLLYPPDWWMRVYYGVPPERSLFGTRWSRHLLGVVNRLGRRGVASVPTVPRRAARSS